MKMILMGTGTSHGIPAIGCDCHVCTSKDPRDVRFRSSAYVTGGADVVIDTGPEFRLQAVKYKIKKLDAVLLTHSHADHLHGLDDVRIFSHSKADDPIAVKNYETEGNGLPIYTNSQSIKDIKYRFAYVFHPLQIGGGIPKISLIDDSGFNLEHPIKIGTVNFVPVPLMHGKVHDSGWLMFDKGGAIAYLTDLNFISEESIEILKNCPVPLKHLVIDGLRIEPHSTHFSFLEALSAAEKIGAQNVYFTHINHRSSHVEIMDYVDLHLDEFPGIKAAVLKGGYAGPAWDGLELET